MQELIEKINERKIKLWIGLDGELHYRAPKGAFVRTGRRDTAK